LGNIVGAENIKPDLLPAAQEWTKKRWREINAGEDITNSRVRVFEIYK
jgi:hypothetical protein